MRRKFARVKRIALLSIATLTIVGAVFGIAAPANATGHTVVSCRSLSFNRGGFGALAECRTFGRHQQRHGEGQFSPGGVDSGTIFWTPPFEGSTAAVPTTVNLVHISFVAQETDKEPKRASCPPDASEYEMTADVFTAGTVTGSFQAELCTGAAGGFPFTLEPHTRATITES
jgi:hypothetical protein